MVESLTIIGASARAAAASAVRAGIAVRAADMFADEDLRALCPAEKVLDYPHGFERILRASPNEPWMYTGGLENHPALVQRLQRIAPLYGNPAEVLRRVRDPLQVAEVLRGAGFLCPDVVLDLSNVPSDGTWLRKPLRSAGGATIEAYCGKQSTGRVATGGSDFQRRISGKPMSGVYAATHQSCGLLGMTRQLIGQDWNGNDGFRYAGSIGPLDAPSHVLEAFGAVGALIAKHFHLHGIFGIDAIVNADGVWPVEVNPRYPASAELIDWAMGLSTIELHVNPSSVLKFDAHASNVNGLVFGKAVVFADRALVIGSQLATLAAQRIEGDWPVMADLPSEGESIPVSDPVVTVFAAAESEDAVLLALEIRAAAVGAVLAS